MIKNYTTKFTWKDKLFFIGLFCLVFVLIPLWAPKVIYDEVKNALEISSIVSGGVENGWQNCCKEWEERGYVVQQAVHVDPDKAHVLAVKLGRRYKSDLDFFYGKLFEKNPLLAAYAFKCLIRTGDIGKSQIPDEIFSRTEIIQVFWAGHLYEQMLGDYINGYFVEATGDLATG